MNKKRILFGILLIMSILLAALVNSQSQNNVYVIRLNYKSEQLSQKLSLIESYPSQGAPVNYGNPLLGYKLDIVSYDNKVMMSLRFKVPAQAVLFKGLTNDVKGSSNNFNFTLYVPYFESANVMNIYDEKKNKVLVIQVKQEGKPTPQEPLKEEASDGAETLNSFYLLLPVMLVIVFLTFLEIKRVKDHKELVRQQNAAALKDYVSANLRKGYTKQQIRNALLKNHYNNQEIEEAFRGIRFIK